MDAPNKSSKSKDSVAFFEGVGPSLNSADKSSVDFDVPNSKSSASENFIILGGSDAFFSMSLMAAPLGLLPSSNSDAYLLGIFAPPTKGSDIISVAIEAVSPLIFLDTSPKYLLTSFNSSIPYDGLVKLSSRV